MHVAGSEDDGVTLSLTAQELFTLMGCITEALEAVEDWEFSTRVGVERDFAISLHSKLSEIAHGL